MEKHAKSSGMEEGAGSKVEAVAQKENPVDFVSSIVLRNLRIVLKF